MTDGVRVSWFPMLINMTHIAAVIQERTCLKLKAKGASQCYFCVAHKTHDSCRFIGIRQLKFVRERVTEERLVSNRQHVQLQLPESWNVESPSDEQIACIKVRLSITPHRFTFADHVRCRGPLRSPYFLSSRRNLSTSNVQAYLCELRRSPYEQHVARIYVFTVFSCVLSHASVVDVCQTSIFSGSWICRKCGKEVCSDCYVTITACRHEDPNMFARGVAKVDSVVRNHHYCTMRRAHFARDFSPLSRFDETQLEDEIRAMEILVASTASLAYVSEPATSYASISSLLNNFPLTPLL